MDRAGMGLIGGIDGQLNRGQGVAAKSTIAPAVDAGLADVKTQISALTEVKEWSDEPVENDDFHLFQRNLNNSEKLRVKPFQPATNGTPKTLLDVHFPGTPIVPGVVSKSLVLGKVAHDVAYEAVFAKTLQPGEVIVARRGTLFKIQPSGIEEAVLNTRQVDDFSIPEDLHLPDELPSKLHQDLDHSGTVYSDHPELVYQKKPFLFVDWVGVNPKENLLRGFYQTSEETVKNLGLNDAVIPQAILEEVTNQIGSAGFVLLKNNQSVLTLDKSVVRHLADVRVGDLIVVIGQMVSNGEGEKRPKAHGYFKVFATSIEDPKVSRKVAEMAVVGQIIPKAMFDRKFKKKT